MVYKDRIERKQLPDLIKQCEDMLSLTQYSVVLLYSKEWVYTVPAADTRDFSKYVLSLDRGSINFKDDLYYKPLEKYLEEVYTTWQGDRKIGATVRNLSDLKKLIFEVRARTGLSMMITKKGNVEE
jgi:hypothetical protein